MKECRYKGLYVYNTLEVDPAASLYTQRADIETFNSGAGPQQKTFTYNNTTKTESGNASKFAFGYSLGFNGDNVYAGLSFVENNSTFDTGSVLVSPNLSSHRIFIGFRF